MAGDKTWTPEWVAVDMIQWFKPSGIILEPCFGVGNIFKHLPVGALFCEIDIGIDFYKFNKNVDWIITNPPFSHYNKFIRHGMNLSDNSVWLMPLWKLFLSKGLMKTISEYGGIKHIRHYDTGGKLGWEMGNLISAIHISRNYTGDIEQSWYQCQV